MLEWIVPVAIGAAALGCFDRPKNQCNHPKGDSKEEPKAKKKEKSYEDKVHNGFYNTELKFGSAFMTAKGESAETAMEAAKTYPEPKNGELLWCSYKFFAYRDYTCYVARAEKGFYKVTFIDCGRESRAWACFTPYKEGLKGIIKFDFKGEHSKYDLSAASLKIPGSKMTLCRAPLDFNVAVMKECCAKHNEDHSFDYSKFLKSWFIEQCIAAGRLERGEDNVIRTAPVPAKYIEDESQETK